MRMTHAQVSKLLALGALGATAAIFLLWLLLAVNVRPYPHGTTDVTNAFLAWFTTGGVAAGLILAHLYIARGLWRESRGERRPVKDGR
jgi:hypothetical protein